MRYFDVCILRKHFFSSIFTVKNKSVVHVLVECFFFQFPSGFNLTFCRNLTTIFIHITNPRIQQVEKRDNEMIVNTLVIIVQKILTYYKIFYVNEEQVNFNRLIVVICFL